MLRKPRHGSSSRGTPDWMIRREVAYGGLITGVARRRISPLDTRSTAELAFGGMTGGDRMLHNRYAPIYAEHLVPFLDTGPIRLAEIGILRGTGLAIWCDLFANARVLGLDIDLAHFENNRADLLRRGPFKECTPELHVYDQLIDGSGHLAEILKGETLDVVIDDGLHSLDAIVTTWRSVRPHLSPRFVYFVEDYAGLLEQCPGEFAGYESRAFGQMTVISAGVSTLAG